MCTCIVDLLRGGPGRRGQDARVRWMAVRHLSDPGDAFLPARLDKFRGSLGYVICYLPRPDAPEVTMMPHLSCEGARRH